MGLAVEQIVLKAPPTMGTIVLYCHGKLEAYPTGLAEHGRLHSGLEAVARRCGIHTGSGLQGCGSIGATSRCARPWKDALLSQ